MFAVQISNLTFSTHVDLPITITRSGQTQRHEPFSHAVYSIFTLQSLPFSLERTSLWSSWSPFTWSFFTRYIFPPRASQKFNAVLSMTHTSLFEIHLVFLEQPGADNHRESSHTTHYSICTRFTSAKHSSLTGICFVCFQPLHFRLLGHLDLSVIRTFAIYCPYIQYLCYMKFRLGFRYPDHIILMKPIS